MKVSVAICTFNGALYIQEQIKSILDQTVRVGEIIISDDASKDKTVALAKTFLDNKGFKNYRIIRNDEQLGVTRNFEQCIKECTGDIIFTSDQDDRWKPTKVEKMCKALENQKCVLAFCDSGVIDGAGNRISDSLYVKDGFANEEGKIENVYDSIIRLSYTIYGCTMAFKKNFIDTIFPFYQSSGNHDAWIMCCAAIKGKIKFVEEQLMEYRIHGGNTVGTIGGNPVWNQIVNEQNAYEKYFAIQPLRTLRIQLLDTAVKTIQSPYENNVRMAKKAIGFYERIRAAGNHGRLYREFILVLSWLDGSYKYRFCDRGRKINLRIKFKQFVCDLLYMIKVRN